MKLKQIIQSVWNSFWLEFKRLITRRYIILKCNELPENLKNRYLYVLGINQPWSVAFLCPCGSEHVIQLSLLTYDSPSWQLTVDNQGRPTLSPSVNMTTKCRSHFFLRNGEIIFV